jgi:hypothetical protein
MCFDFRRLDTVFPYPTAKIARIKDSRLGLLRYALQVLVAVYVIGYHIMWKGNHLETQDIAGVYQLQLAHPTRDYCDPVNIECMQNFTGMAELPYCAQSAMPGSIKLPCEYWDASQLAQLTDQGLMIPTHVATYYQTKGCKPEAGNNWTCKGWLYDYLDRKGNVQVGKRGMASPISDLYIADIERYTLMIDHSVRSSMGARTYASEMAGAWLDCANGDNQSDAGCIPRDISCGHKDCHGKAAPTTPVASQPVPEMMNSVKQSKRKTGGKKSLRRPAVKFMETDSNVEELSQVLDQGTSVDLKPDVQADSSKQPRQATVDSDDDKGVPVRMSVEGLEKLGVVNLLQGDIFTISKLLKAANVSLDEKRHNVPAWVGGSYRSSGFVLVVRIHYTNKEPWLGMKVLPWKQLGPTPHYTHRITKHASHDDFMLRQVYPGGPKDPPNARVVKEYHGIRVLVEQSGTIALWNNVQLLLILTTTLALTTLFAWCTDMVALYCLPQSEEYWAIKYERPRTRKKRRSSNPEEEEEAPEAEDDRIMRYDSMTM